ncbi:hypothetical protein AAC387_Pa09g0894 [Persea americana]
MNQRLFTLPPALQDQLLLPLNFLAASYFSPSSGQDPHYQFHRLASPSPAAAPLPIPAAPAHCARGQLQLAVPRPASCCPRQGQLLGSFDQ